MKIKWYRTSTVVIAALCHLTAIAIFAAPGDLDTSFGKGGRLTDGVLRHGRDDAYGVAVQSDGKIVVAGSSESSLAPTLARYDPDGSLDATFGTNGLISGCQAGDVAIQPDGKIVVGCSLIFDGDGGFVIGRYNTDGSLDTSFGNGGSVVTSIAGDARIFSIALGPEGKIVAVGTVFTGRFDRHIAVARYDPDGSPDASFDGDGLRETSVGNFSEGGSVAVQPDGKIVVGGEAYLPPIGFPGVLIRYNVDGSPDTSFEMDGVAISTLSAGRPAAVAIQPDGKILTAAGTGSSFFLERYNDNGALDKTFGGDGRVITPMNGSNGALPAGANTLRVQPDGKIVAAGYSYVSTTGLNDTDIALARYNPNGSLDNTFDLDGKVTTPVNFGTSEINSLALQPDGSIVSVGFTRPNRSDSSSSGDDNFLVARYNPNGSLDASFDTDGIVITDFSYPVGGLSDVAIQTDGKIVAIGGQLVRYYPDGTRDATFGGGTGMADVRGNVVKLQADGRILTVSSHSCGDDDSLAATITRLDQNGSLDESFGTGGIAELGPCPDGAGYFWFNALAIQPDGKIVAAGGRNTGNTEVLLARYNIDGSLDTTFAADGIATTAIGNAAAEAVAIQSDGKVVVAGGNWNGSFSLARYDADGSLDTTFDGDGKVTTIIGTQGDAASVAIQSDGKIVAAGYSTVGSSKVIAVVRYNANGSLDETFDSDGIVITTIGPGDNSASSVAIDRNGQLVVAATSHGDFALLHYLSNGSLDTTFGGGDGSSTVDFGISNDQVYGMALDRQGRAVLVGSSSGASAVARFLPGPLQLTSGKITNPNAHELP